MDSELQALPTKLTSQEDDDFIGFICTDQNGFCIKSNGDIQGNHEELSGYIGAITKRSNKLFNNNNLQNKPIINIECENVKYIIQNQGNINVCIVKQNKEEEEEQQTTTTTLDNNNNEIQQ
ncbi:hypothetical protein ABK040_015338 [Willaertia magna]